MDKRTGIAILGTGNLAEILTRELCGEKYEAYRLLGIWGRDREKAKRLADKRPILATDSLEELLALHPAYVLEATTVEGLKWAALPILHSGVSLIALSAGALADSNFRRQVKNCCRKGSAPGLVGPKLYVASGAIGGFDFMQTAAMMGDLSVHIRNVKPPQAYHNAPFLKGRNLPEEEAQVIFSGNAAQAIACFPQNVNVAVAAAEATVGSEKAWVTVESDPALSSNAHIIELEGRFGRASFTMESRPSEKNPGSSIMAAYSVLNLLQRLTEEIVFW
jgi:aspartate dehydrogenase